MNEIISRIIASLDELIADLEAVDKYNRDLVGEANNDPDNPEIRQWARLARENQQRLQWAKAERDYLQENYSNPNLG